ncbi:MAG: alpha-glucan family phosphorylase [Candidatus Pacebacteria bacterium]|nr:alpha-glucan family phosphorylase [Candidatus Paceibacterota bacterium]
MQNNENKLLDVAYFSMEVALESAMNTYSGGLGVLAGDTLKTLADFNSSAVGITLLNEQGYVNQEIDPTGKQVSEIEKWNKEDFLTKTSIVINVPFKDRQIKCAVWQYNICGQFGKKVPVYFLDSNLAQNNKYDRSLTSFLYGGDNYYRLGQEQILGLGGLMLLAKLGFSLEKVKTYHLNEGHASFAGLSLFKQAKEEFKNNKKAKDYVASKLVFTTHTPVAAGHDRFSLSDVKKNLSTDLFNLIPQESLVENNLCMTSLSLYFSGVVTGVAMTHEKVTEAMFPKHDVINVTNGAYHLQWTHPQFKKVYDKYIPEWRQDPAFFRKAKGIPDEVIWSAHMEAKKELIKYVNKIAVNKFSEDVLTLGYARRFTSYKRPTMILSDLDKLEKSISKVGKLQIIFAGEAHPLDREGSKLIGEVFQRVQKSKGKVNIVFLEDYNMDMAIKLVAGVDVWLNTPLQKHEASGTSGMKASFNAISHLSVLDGWWPEGWIEGVTGWSIGSNSNKAILSDKKTWKKEVDDLYHKIANIIMPMYYEDRSKFIEIMKNAVSLNGSYFNTYRMMQEYMAKVYFPLQKNIFTQKNLKKNIKPKK